MKYEEKALDSELCPFLGLAISDSLLAPSHASLKHEEDVEREQFEAMLSTLM